MSAHSVAPMNPAPLAVIVMGVCGSGKSGLAERLASALGAQFIEGDAFHSPRNIERMAAGIALTDADREDWLRVLAAQLAQARADARSIVLACSALKRAYRDLLREGAPDLRLVHLSGTRALLAERVANRPGHYMPASLLDSQLATLEVPQADEAAIRVDGTGPTAEIVADALNRLGIVPAEGKRP